MDETLILYQKLCFQYGYSVYQMFNRLYIKTRYEQWYIQKSNDWITLYHKNQNDCKKDSYHKQFCKKINDKDTIDYIHNHEIFRFGPAKCLP